MKADKHKPIKLNSDGEIERKVDPDGTERVTSKKPVSMHMESITAVGIENIVEVEQHTINKAFGSVSHLVKFRGGGEIRFSYNAKGDILEFSTKNVDAHVADGTRLVLRGHAKGTKARGSGE